MRLPECMTELRPVQGCLTALETEMERLREDGTVRLGEMTVSEAGETGLALWERDYGLPSAGSVELRRKRVLAALTDGQTLTVEELKRLGLAFTDADEAVVTEWVSRRRVFLSLLFDGEAPEDFSELEQLLEQRRPAHLQLQVQTSLPFRDVIYYGKADPLSMARGRNGAATVGRYALMGGGGPNDDGVSYGNVDAYDLSLVHTLPVPLSKARNLLCGASIGEYALFAGGLEGSVDSSVLVDAYSTSLTRSAATSLSQKRNNLESTTVGGYAVIGGGQGNRYYTHYANVDAYDASLVRTSPQGFSLDRGWYSAVTLGDHALFCGGYSDPDTNVVDAYDSSLVRTVPTALSSAIRFPGAAVVGGRALVLCPNASVDVYDPSLTRTNIPGISRSRGCCAGFTLGEQALFAGGVADGVETDAYDASLTRTLLTGLTPGRNMYDKAVVLGNYALLAGGLGPAADVDVYQY